LSKNAYHIREIIKSDNLEIAQAIRSVLIEYGVPKIGTAYEDEALDKMFEAYNNPKASYFIILKDKTILGGAGIMPLQNSKENICELQKMYFLPEARGKGLGTKMMNHCFEIAKEFGFEKCYLETLPYMVEARKLYAKSGFESLTEAIGNTGHHNCTMWMLKTL